jgi:hypothetical protein
MSTLLARDSLPSWERRFWFRPFASEVCGALGSSAKHIGQQLAERQTEASPMIVVPCLRLELQTISAARLSTRATMILSRGAPPLPEELAPKVLTPATVAIAATVGGAEHWKHP